MNWSLPSAVVDWAQVISAVLSLLALVLALFAIWNSKRDIARERRINHELEVLRDLGELIYQFGEVGMAGLGRSGMGRLRAGLLMLPGSRDLPKLRVAVNARPSKDVQKDFWETNPDAELWANEPGYPVEVLWKDGILDAELEDAINRRLASNT
jgi:hypothetical protein